MTFTRSCFTHNFTSASKICCRRVVLLFMLFCEGKRSIHTVPTRCERHVYSSRIRITADLGKIPRAVLRKAQHGAVQVQR